MNLDRAYNETSKKTAENLRSVARSREVLDLTPLTLPEIDAVIDLVSRIVPAGNVPGVILSGLTRLSGRRLPLQNVKRDINLLFKGVEQTLDKALYATFFAGPAAVIWAYQNLIKLIGKNPDDAFPEGTWQFYVNYALRDDTARHANETHGFDTALTQHQIQLNEIDRITAWVMASIYSLHQYPALLENEWRERVYTNALREMNPDRYAALYRTWCDVRPYARRSDAAANEDYPLYRRVRFDRFMDNALRDLRSEQRREWIDRVRAIESAELAAYQQQLSILAYLEPSAYGEARTPIDLTQAHVGVIYRGHYFLIPACAPDSDQPADITHVRSLIAAIVTDTNRAVTTHLADLACVKRAAHEHLRSQLHHEDLSRLRLAPILINCDARSRRAPLSEIRQAERGLGDHPLTIFDTGETFVFDQSHIFFDGAWGAALAEILTNEALAWAVYLNSISNNPIVSSRPDELSVRLSPADLKHIQQAPRVAAESCAETDAINVKSILTLRKLFKQRSDLLDLTVNDLLVLYRAIHAITYQPDPTLLKALEKLAKANAFRSTAQAALEAIDSSRQANPAILIPVDASLSSPRARLHPMSFEVPLKELDLIGLHAKTIEALQACTRSDVDRSLAYEEFDKLQRMYLATLAGFAVILNKAKAMTLTGESASVGTIKLLAHMPLAMQRFLDKLPDRFDVLNDIIKGREVFSNIGAVSPDSTLVRFTTAKDDNEKKTLAWGVLTDANDVMRITLRDFRPHVEQLAAIDRMDLAKHITQDYIDSYARGLNNFVRDLQHIALASHETRVQK